LESRTLKDADVLQHPARQSVFVSLGNRSYDIVIATDELPAIGAELDLWLASHGRQRSSRDTGLVVTDRNVAQPHADIVARSLAAANWHCQTVVLEPGEPSKSLDVAATLFDRLVEMKADRNTLVVAVGGGVIGDLAGFVAATYARGVPFVQVPTTLLAQVDSSVGGKVGVNHPLAKNLIGAFYQPLGVFIDTSLLVTLPDREYRAGLAEVIKYGVILDADFFAYLESHRDEINRRDPAVLRYIVARCCRLKADVVEQDEFERTGLRAVLNYGHTFAHAFEALAGYGELLHGEAVSIGMVCASRLAERLGRINATVTARQVSLLESVGLPTRLPDTVRPSSADILARMQLDKKTVGGKLRFVLPDRIGHVELVKDVDERAVAGVCQTL
jgi:3-dehydroquinate synthase